MVTDEGKEQFLATLRAVHDFPGRYTFKLIGDNGGHLLVEALQVLRTALPGTNPEVSRRESAQGHHQSITLSLEVPDAETVHDLYAEFRQLTGLKVLL